MLYRRVIFLKQRNWIRYGLIGTVTGLVNGFFGAGGGMVLVPLLVNFGKLENKKAFSSAIAMILPMCVTTIAVYGLHGQLPLGDALPYLLGGLAGGLLGGILFRSVTVQFLNRAFALVILWGGLRLLWS